MCETILLELLLQEKSRYTYFERFNKFLDNCNLTKQEALKYCLEESKKQNYQYYCETNDEIYTKFDQTKNLFCKSEEDISQEDIMEYNKLLSNIELLTDMYDNDAGGIDYERIRIITDKINGLEGDMRIQFLKNLNSYFVRFFSKNKC